MYTLKYLLKETERNQVNLNDKWVPGRPLPFYGTGGLWKRLKDAWEVFKGRADAFTWPEGQ